MHVVIFEVTPKEGRKESYLEMAAKMKAHLDGFDGFLSVERFESLTEPGKLLSLSFWRDAAAVDAWRKLEAHRVAQDAGRNRLFAEYRLSVAEIARQYSKTDRDEVPKDSRDIHG